MSDHLRIEIDGTVATVTLARPEKRNAINEHLVSQIGAFFRDPPREVRAAVLAGDGAHFCAGLDLDEMSRRTPFDAMELLTVMTSDVRGP